MSTSASHRATQLRLRCEMQRQQLADEFAQIEQRFRSTDAVLGSIRNFVGKPSFILSSIGLLLFRRRRKNKNKGKSSLGSLLRRGLFWYATGRRAYQALRSFKSH